MIPMRLTEIEVGDLDAYVADDEWGMQQKMDGARALFIWQRTTSPVAPEHRDGDLDDEVTITKGWISSRGGPLKHAASALHLDRIGQSISNYFEEIGARWVVLDGEIIPEQGIYHVFDIVHGDYSSRISGQQVERAIGPSSPFASRYTYLWNLLTPLAEGTDDVRLVSLASTSETKEALVTKVRDAGAEGLVMRHRDGTWREATRSKEVLKAKFVKTADVVVMDWKRGTTEAGNPSGSCTFGVHVFVNSVGEVVDEPVPAGNYDLRLVRLGQCSLIGKPDVEIGDVIEVAYLFRDPNGGGLLQPRMLRTRPDRDRASCTLAQFPAYSREAVQ